VADARRRKIYVVLCWRLDRLGRSLRHLVILLEELRSVGVEFVSLGEGIDATTPAGKLQLHILAALAEFERARIAERVRAGLARARAAGRRLEDVRACTLRQVRCAGSRFGKQRRSGVSQSRRRRVGWRLGRRRRRWDNPPRRLRDFRPVFTALWCPRCSRDNQMFWIHPTSPPDALTAAFELSRSRFRV
jgi:hypothetical protein